MRDLNHQVVSINFGFENCDYAEIPIDEVHSFSLGDITKSRSFYPHNQGFQDYDVIGSLFVGFNSSFENFEAMTQFDTNTVYERLTKYNDICWFGIKYEDGTEDNYQVKWKGSDQYENKAQRHTNYGMGLVILVNEDGEAE